MPFKMVLKNRWTKVLGAMAFAVLVGACGKDNGQSTAGVPQEDCTKSGTCSWSHFPNHWMRPNPNTYAGYGHNNSGCAMGTYPVNRPGYPEICAPVERPWSYSQVGNSILLCEGIYPAEPNNPTARNRCPSNTRCRAIPYAHSQYGRDWNTPAFGGWGFCEYVDPRDYRDQRQYQQ